MSDPITTALDAATHIEVAADVRYWEDTEINGVEDTDGTLVPGRDGETWKVKIDLATGQIQNWPADTNASIHYKICDAGEYWLLNAAGARIAKWRGHYVPDDFLCHGDDGFGDYIIFDTYGDGRIVGYSKPGIDPMRWGLLPSVRLGGGE